MSASASPPEPFLKHSKSSPTPSTIKLHTTNFSTASSNHSNVLSPLMNPNIYANRNSYSRKSAVVTSYGKSPVSLSANDNTIKFDYNIFVTTWQDQIKMRQYSKCENYCREVIEKLLNAQQQYQLASTFGGILNNNDNSVHTLQEYRSKVHFSLAYLLKKYMKRYDEAREQYEESIKTDRENPGAHFNLANMLVDHFKDFKLAEYHFKLSISLEPSYALYRMTYAEFLWHDCSRYADSSQQYRELIKLHQNDNINTQNEDIYFNYGLLLRDHLNELDKSINQFKICLKINSNDIEAKEELNYTINLFKKQQQQQQQQQQQVIINNDDDSDDDSDDNSDDDDIKISSPTSLNKISSITISNVDDDNDYNSQKKAYQANRKRNSSFRRSQHDLFPNLTGTNNNNNNDDDNINYAAKYNQLLDEKYKLNIIIKQNQQQLYKLNNNILNIKSLINNNNNYKNNKYKRNKNKNNSFKNKLDLYVLNGPLYIQQNSKNVHKILKICKNVINQIDTLNIPKIDKIDDKNGYYNRKDSDCDYNKHSRNQSVI